MHHGEISGLDSDNKIKDGENHGVINKFNRQSNREEVSMFKELSSCF